LGYIREEASAWEEVASSASAIAEGQLLHLTQPFKLGIAGIIRTTDTIVDQLKPFPHLVVAFMAFAALVILVVVVVVAEVKA